MPSPDTSAQDAPRTTDYCAVCGESPQSATHEGMPGGHAWTRRAASQEAEAREAVVRAGWSFGGPNRGPNGRDARTAINDALDAYAAAIRATERERYATLVEGVRALHNGHGGTICYSACIALAALEEAMG